MTAPRDPEELGTTTQPAHAAIADDATVGAVHLTVSDLERSIDYYRTAIGLAILEQGGGEASLGTPDRELLHLVEEAGARPTDGYTGLYHFALLLPERTDLARWLAHAARDRVGMTGLSDHFVSEALYLRDPDDHGIEIYWDRPREQWEGQVVERMTTLPLDVDSISRRARRPGERRRSTDCRAGRSWATCISRWRTIARDDPLLRRHDRLRADGAARAEAAFLCAGGYHHHLGANTWESAGAPPPPPGQRGAAPRDDLLPDEAERGRVIGRLEQASADVADLDGDALVRDPSGNALVLALA